MTVAILDSWSFTDDDDPSAASLTLSGGTGKRALVLIYGSGGHDISEFGWTITTITVGGVAPTLNYKTGDGSDDAPRFIGIWDEADLDAMSGAAVVWTATTITNEFWGYATYNGVDQTDLSAVVKDATNHSTDQPSISLTTTSNAGDRIIVLDVINTGNKNFTDWDTLVELHDVAASTNNSRYGAGEGNGGDDTTAVTNTTFGRPNGASIVLPNFTSLLPKMMQEGHLNG